MYNFPELTSSLQIYATLGGIHDAFHTPHAFFILECMLPVMRRVDIKLCASYKLVMLVYGPHACVILVVCNVCHCIVK